jgi:hypothetical protein
MQRLAQIVARCQKPGTVVAVLRGALCESALALFYCTRFHPMTSDSRGRRIRRASPGEAPCQKSKVIANWICWDLSKAASSRRARSFSVHRINDTPTSPFTHAPIAQDLLSMSDNDPDRFWAREVADKNQPEVLGPPSRPIRRVIKYLYYQLITLCKLVPSRQYFSTGS